MNAIDFLDFILEKHHGEEIPEEEEYGERDPPWEREDNFWAERMSNGHLPDGYEWIDDVDK